MKKLLNRIETSATSSSVQLQGSTALSNNGGIGSGGHGGGGAGSTNSSNSSASSSQSNVLGKTISLKKVSNISVDEIIAEGGFGIVYLAKANSVKYALKRVVVNNEVDLNVVTREIQIMTTLSHPNLLPCIDFMVTPLGNNVTEALLLMPYYRSTLLNLLNQRMSSKSHLSEKEVLMILLDIVSAIARLHHCTTPIIHRDIKIENVLIDESPSTSSPSSNSSAAGGNESFNRYILCDFGSATAKVWDPHVNSIQSIQDDLEKYTTLAYRAPEMVDLYSNRGTLNTKIDIWALGIFTYKVCFYTTPFGDSILAIQSANLTFPASTTYSQQLHALIYYLLTPDSAQRPDIYQTGELISQMLKIKNPIQNLNGSPPPPSFDVLTSNMTTRKQSTTDAVIINKASGAAVVPLETSVTPRQRPKGNTILTAPANGNILIIPPPKSPCKLQPDPPPATLASSESDGRISHHRRNVSDSSAFEKSQLQPSSELCSTTATSEQAINSWNPFEETLTANLASATISAIPPPPTTTTATTTEPSTASASAPTEDDDPFENAPFEFFKYQPIDLTQEDDDESDAAIARFEEHSPVDLFGAAPFSNPFLQFQLGNGIQPPPRPTSSSTDSLDNQAQIVQHSFHNPQQQPQQKGPPSQRQPSKVAGTGVTNLSYED